MLTRSGVAKRLGKSIATIRRMEGVELHPFRDERGIHRFSADEVEAVARGGAAADRRHRIAGLLQHRRNTEANDDFVEISEERSGDELFAEVRRRHEAREAQRLAERIERDRAQAVRREVSRQVEHHLAVVETTRVLEELAVTLKASGKVLDEAELNELYELMAAVEAELD